MRLTLSGLYDALHLLQLCQQLGQRALAVQIQTVTGNVLCYHQQFLDPAGGKAFGFGDHILHGNAAEGAANVGDHAVGTLVVAALSDAQIGAPGIGEQHSVTGEAVGLPLLEPGPLAALVEHIQHGLHDVVTAAHAHGGIHFGQLVEELLLIPLGQTAGNDQTADDALFFQFGQLQNGLDGLSFGAFNKAAGVDDGNVRPFGGFQQFHAGVDQMAQHQLGVAQVFCAAQGQQIYFYIVFHSASSMFRE